MFTYIQTIFASITKNLLFMPSLKKQNFEFSEVSRKYFKFNFKEHVKVIIKQLLKDVLPPKRLLVH